MKKSSVRKTTLTVSALLAFSITAGAQNAPDLTGKSGFGMSGGMMDKPDLTGKSDNSRFSANAMRARSGQGPDLTGRVQEERRPMFNSQNSTADSGGGLGSSAIVMLLAVLVLGAGAMLYKGMALSKSKT